MPIPRRQWLSCNIPMLLDLVVLAYVVQTRFLLGGSMVLCAVLSTMTLWSLHQAALARPGRASAVDVDRKHPVCAWCDVTKLPRTHHCRWCRECVERYDHHCIWIDNCVGRSNHKAFILFTFYILAAIVHYLVMLGGFILDGRLFRVVEMGRIGIVMLVLMLFYVGFVVPTTILAAVFLCSSVVMTLRNQTTYERSHSPESRLVYSKGCLRNWCEVFGDRAELWLLPTLVHKTAGSISTVEHV